MEEITYPQLQLSVKELKHILVTTGDFLHITRSHEYTMPAFSFDVTCKHSLSKSKVSIPNTGIILFEPLANRSNEKLNLSIKNIVISCAIHGNETAPIEICNELIKQLVLGDIHLEHRVLFLIGNPPAVNLNKRFVEENLNSVFSNSHLFKKEEIRGFKNKERERALLLENVVKDFYLTNTVQGSFKQKNYEINRFHFDLHTAIRCSKYEKFAIYPYLHNKVIEKTELQFLLACDINTILFSKSPSTSFCYYSSNTFGAKSVTIELGKVKPFGQNEMDKFQNIKSSFISLITQKSVNFKTYNKNDFNFYQFFQVIIKKNKYFKLNFATDIANFTEFTAGSLIATDGEREIKTLKKGEAVVFPNAKVALGQRALLTVVPVDVYAI